MADISVIKMPNNTSYNLKDATARENIDNLVAIQDEQPANGNKIWIKATPPTSVQVPTVSEMNEALAGKVGDVQINGTSILSNGIANIPKISYSTFGMAQLADNGIGGIAVDSYGHIIISRASVSQIKAATDMFTPIVPKTISSATFYGLAKAAGADMKDIANTTVGTYPDAQKAAIQNMLGITDLISTEEVSTATAAHAINSTFMMNGKLHRATAAIAIGDAVEVGTNCEAVKVDEVFVKNTDYAKINSFGVVKFLEGNGILVTNGIPYLVKATNEQIQAGSFSYGAIVPNNQHTSIYYGLSKLAGVDLASETVTVGIYPETSKTAIQNMLGVPSTAVATSSAAGLMSAADKSKLDGFTTANNYMTQCIIPFGYMDSSSTSTAYVATVPNVTTLTDGLAVYITNTIVNATGTFTLNVNNLGAKEVCWSDEATMRVSTTFKKNQTYLFIYNSSRITNGSWDLYKGFDSDKDTLAFQVLNNNQFTIAKNSIIGPKLIFTTIDGKILAPNTQDTTASTKTMTTEVFNPFAPIYAYTYPMTISANNSPIVKGMLSIFYSNETGIDLRYSFNISTNLTIKNPVYLKCEPQSDGTAKFINDNSIVQSLPSTEDGYIYIYLGDALSTTNISLSLNHPIYEYKNSGIQLWNNIRNATNNTSGLMSSTDKSKLDNIESSANNYVLPAATQTALGGVKVNPNYGIKIEDDTLKIIQPVDAQIRTGLGAYTFITAAKQHISAFFGLAKAAGDSTQASSSNSVGTYTDDAKLAIQTMLGVNGKLNVSEKGAANGVAELDSTGKVPSSQLPSYVDDVLEYASQSAFPSTGESGKIYIAQDTNKTYRWSGSAYAEISESLALGETSSTAYRGDRGAAAYAAAVTNVETTPTSTSGNLITSGGVYTALGDYAPKANPVFTESISLGRKENTNIGFNSIAIGMQAEANSPFSVALGINSTSSSASSLAIGTRVTASGSASIALGMDNIASAPNAHVEGYNNIANGGQSFVYGMYNVADSYDNWSLWQANTSYSVGDKVKRLVDTDRYQGYVCKTPNSDSSFNIDKWDSMNSRMNYAQIIGNGTASQRSNAYALTWNGDGKYAGDVYVNCDSDSTGGVKLATIEDVESLAVEVIRL